MSGFDLDYELELASKSHKAYLDMDKNQAIAERLDREIRRFKLALRYKFKEKSSENDIKRCVDTISLLKIIRGDLE